MMAQRNTGIDIFKVLMALVVVMIHTSGANPAVFKIAVPFFFIASGYFFFRNWESGGKEAIVKGRRWLMRIAVMYLAWTLIYLPFTVLGFLQDGLGLGKSLAVFIRNLLFVGENYLSWPLWYLLASLWAGVIFLLFRSFRTPVWVILLVSLALYAAAALLHVDQMHWHQSIFKSGDFRILQALCFMSMGGFLRTFLNKVPFHPKWMGAAMLLIVSIVFARCLWPLAAIFLFVLSEGLRIPGISNEIGQMFRDISTFVFLIHMIFAGLAFLLFGFGKSWLFFLLIAAVSLVVSSLFVRYKSHHRIVRLLLGEL